MKEGQKIASRGRRTQVCTVEQKNRGRGRRIQAEAKECRNGEEAEVEKMLPEVEDSRNLKSTGKEEEEMQSAVR
jgi:hypothetical protein